MKRKYKLAVVAAGLISLRKMNGSVYEAREEDIRNAHNILPGKLKRRDQFER
jgi:hypothetical protein